MTPERWQMVRGILQSAVELRPQERAAFLDRECAEDPILRKDVDEMLSAERKLAPDFLESPAAAQVEFPAGSFASASTLGAGTQLGNYEIRALLGAGGMGQVYICNGCDFLERWQVGRLCFLSRPYAMAQPQRRIGTHAADVSSNLYKRIHV